MLLSGLSPNFTNTGADEAILKQLNAENPSEELVKALNKNGLVQKEVQVRTKNGVHTRKQWVKASDVKSTEPKQSNAKEDKKESSKDIASQIPDNKINNEWKWNGDSEFQFTTSDGKIVHGEEVDAKEIKNGDTVILYNGINVFAIGKVTTAKETTLRNGDKAVYIAVDKNGREYSSEETSTVKRLTKIEPKSDNTKPSTQSQAPKSEPKKEDTGHITGTTMNDLVGNLKSKGYEMDSADRRQPQDKVTLYKDGKEFTATFNKYSNGDVEVLNIKEVKSESKKSDDDEPMKVPNKLDMHIDTPTNETWFEGNINGTRVRVLQEKVGNNDWWIAEVGGKTLKDDNDKAMTFESPREAEEEAEDSIAESKKNEPKPSNSKPRKVQKADDVANGIKSINRKIANDMNIHNGVSALQNKSGDGVYGYSAYISVPKFGGDESKAKSTFEDYAKKEFGDKVSLTTKKSDGYPDAIIIEVRVTDGKSKHSTPEPKTTTTTGTKMSNEDAKKKTQSFTNKVAKTESDRNNFMSKVKSQGITWKENDNAGINWMRCCMALNKHFANGGTFDENNSASSSSDTPKSLSDDDIKQLFNENKSKLKDVMDEYGLKEDDMIANIIGAVRDYEEEMEEPMPKDEIIEMMLDENNQW